jgi:hypothetical protein
MGYDSQLEQPIKLPLTIITFQANFLFAESPSSKFSLFAE